MSTSKRFYDLEDRLLEFAAMIRVVFEFEVGRWTLAVQRFLL